MLSEDVQQHVENSGMDGYISKPASLDKLTEILIDLFPV